MKSTLFTLEFKLSNMFSKGLANFIVSLFNNVLCCDVLYGSVCYQSIIYDTVDRGNIWHKY